MFQNVHAKVVVHSVNLTIIFNFDFATLLYCIYKHVVQQFAMQYDRSSISNQYRLTGPLVKMARLSVLLLE